MFGKIRALFDSGNLANYTWFFACILLGIAAITGMAWHIVGRNRENKGAAHQKRARINECL